MNNDIEKVTDIVFNHDKEALGLLFLDVDTTGLSESKIKLYMLSYDTRLDLMGFELSFIVYCKNHDTPKIDDFKQFIKTNKRGIELFQRSREVAAKYLEKNLSPKKLLRKNKQRDIIKLYSIFLLWLLCLIFLSGLLFFGLSQF